MGYREEVESHPSNDPVLDRVEVNAHEKTRFNSASETMAVILFLVLLFGFLTKLSDHLLNLNSLTYVWRHP